MRRVVSWVLRVALAVVFVAAGAGKLAGDAAAVSMFEGLGGQWLRFFVGACEVAGGVGLLVPKLHRAAAAGLALLMVGATIANVAVLGFSPVVTIALLLAAVTVLWLRPAPRVRPAGRPAARAA
ncbi:DoxX family membrane protein [Kineococcus sp. SYSU DK001]|uniref:DoxX family membrane protein n=1 Tax=Kineococcus sp. SYSU DK001 TaxID=3383122 RepID=UPI003D7DF451